jgi:hypothetical protein
MEPDDLLCSRNAHDKNVLVRRAQWKINQAPSPEEKASELGRIILILDARSEEQRGQLGYSMRDSMEKKPTMHMI